MITEQIRIEPISPGFKKACGRCEYLPATKDVFKVVNGATMEKESVCSLCFLRIYQGVRP